MKILVPVDLSDIAINALDYARMRFPNAEITVLHVIGSLMDLKLPSLEIPGLTIDVVRRQEINSMICKKWDIDDIPENVHIELYYGEPVRVINQYVHEGKFDAVVIGSRDNYHLWNRILGTTALGIIKTLKIPVLVIPHNQKYKLQERILVASNDQLENEGTLERLDYWNTYNAQMMFLNIKTDDYDDFSKEKEAIIRKYYEEREVPYSYEIKSVYNGDVVRTLLNEAKEYHADAIVVIAANQNFIESLFIESTTKELLFNSTIPMLFLHSLSNNLNNQSNESIMSSRFF